MQRNYARSVLVELTILVVVIGIFLIPSRLVAQGDGTGIDATGADDAAGASNPTGPSGIFNGNVTTAGSYDPSTGNAMRVVDDIVVPGCVGAYPLKWTRYYNSRQTQYYNSYGKSKVPASSGAWTFAYDYGYGIANGHQSVMLFPDGRSIDLAATVPPTGLAEHIGNWNGQLAIFLGDGGKVTFMTYDRTSHYLSANQWVSIIVTEYLPDKIVDPYGKVTTISYEDVIDDSNSYHDSFKRRKQITEPGGRYLKLTYGNVLRLNPQDPNDTRIDEFTVDQFIVKVEAFDGIPGDPAIQSVTYTYQNNWNFQGNTYNYCVLSKATYSDGAVANYVYNYGDYKAFKRPVLWNCDDPRYGGPMRQIQYNFDKNGVIISEQKPSGPIVSTIAGVTNGKLANDTPLTQTETRGDLATATRKFTYFYAGANSDNTDLNLYKIGKLLDYTDFAQPQHHTILDYDNTPGSALGFLKSVTDANQNKTIYTRSSTSWGIHTITHYAPNGTEIDHISQTFTDDANPYYLHDRTDERGKTTTYHRDDPNNANAITEIDYPTDGSTPASSETFEYNARGQVTKHRLRNGAYQHFQYDSRWLLVAKWNPTSNPTAVPSDPQTTYTYYAAGDFGGVWTDRIKTETDPRGNTTTYEYDYGFDTNGNNTSVRAAGRGLVTKITHADNTCQLFVYNKYGDKMWEENENHERTSYAFDDYGRVLTVKNPLNKTIATNDYTPPSGVSFYAHTTSSVNTTTTATGVVIKNNYDANWRRTSVINGYGSANPSTTWFDYDAVGNPTKVTDPRGSGLGDPNHTTITDYDARNRKWHVWDALTHQTTFGYDPASNVITITRPDLSVEIKTYDALNRLLTDTIPKEGTPPQLPTETITTQFAYNPSGSLYSVTDGKNQTTTFEYDPSDLKTKMTYPNGTDYQSWTYDPAKNLIARRTVNGVSQLFSYDSRNRQFAMAWSDGADWANFAYDDASRMISAENPTSTITRAYDAAGRLTLDRQRLRILPLTAVSRKIHGSAGTFNIALPLVGTPGIECRTGGANNAHQIVVTFPRTVTLSGASVTSGTGSVSGSPIVTDGTTVTINLTGVTNAQTITVTLAGVNDGITTNNVNINMGVLAGDTTGNGFANSADVSQTQSQSGQSVSSSNFREDVTANGFINSGDVGFVQSKSGSALASFSPLPPPVSSSPDIDVHYDYYDDGTEKQLFATQNGAPVGPNGYNFTYGYDEQRRFKTISNTGGAQLFQYGYDKASNVIDRTNLTANGINQHYTIDELNRPTRRDLVRGTSTIAYEVYGYDANRPGLLVSVDREDGKRDQFGYDLLPELTSSQYGLQQGAGTVATNSNGNDVDPIAYGDHANGNDPSGLIGFGNSGGGPSGGGVGSGGNLLIDPPLDPNSAQTNWSSPNRAVNYTWDKAGNRISLTDNGPGAQSYNYGSNNLNQYWTDGTSGAGGLIGNGSEHELSSYRNLTYKYINDTHLSSINGNGNDYQLNYDALGRCVVRVLSTPSGSKTNYYIYDGEKPILEYGAAYGLGAWNVYGRGIDEILMRSVYLTGASGTQLYTLYYQDDHEGSVTHLTDQSGNIVEWYRYDAFGAPTFFNAASQQIGGTNWDNRFLFTGREYVLTFSIYEYRNRAYHPGLGRFMSEDPKGFDAGDNNFFRYCGNDPMDRTDPLGLSDLSETAQKQIDQTNQKADQQFKEAVDRYDARSVEAKQADTKYYNDKGMKQLGLEKNIGRMTKAVQDPSKRFDNRSLLKQSLTKVINAYLAHKIQMGTPRLFAGRNASNIVASDHKDTIYVNPAKASHANFDETAVELVHEGTHMVPGHDAVTNAGEFGAYKAGADMGNHGLGLRVTVPHPDQIHTDYNLPDD
jgi:RHS repeat-associated protein